MSNSQEARHSPTPSAIKAAKECVRIMGQGGVMEVLAFAEAIDTEMTPEREVSEQLLEAAKAVAYLEAREWRMRQDYPPGTCNAEDAWRDFGNEHRDAWKSLRAAITLATPALTAISTKEAK